MTAFFGLFIFIDIFNSFNARTSRLDIFANILDNKVFIGIVTRKDAIQYLIDELKKRKYDGTAADKIKTMVQAAK